MSDYRSLLPKRDRGMTQIRKPDFNKLFSGYAYEYAREVFGVIANQDGTSIQSPRGKDRMPITNIEQGEPFSLDGSLGDRKKLQQELPLRFWGSGQTRSEG